MPKLPAKSSREFQAVSVSALSGAQLRRNPAAAIVKPSGETRLNANSCTLLGQLAHEADLDPNQFSVTFGVNLAGQLIAIYPAAPGTLGAPRSGFASSGCCAHRCSHMTT